MMWGGWPCYSITEDAALGVALQAQGYRTRYIAQVIAHGTMPLNVASARQQRRRWIRGNVDVLRQAQRSGRYVSWAGIVQLTSWLNVLVIPLSLHILSLGVATRYPLAAGYGYSLLGCYVLCFAGRWLHSYWQTRSPRLALQMLAVRSLYSQDAALAWLPNLWRRAERFVRTAKPDRRKTTSAAKRCAIPLVLGVVLLGQVSIALPQQPYLAGTSLGFLVMVVIAHSYAALLFKQVERAAQNDCAGKLRRVPEQATTMLASQEVSVVGTRGGAGE